MLFKPPVTSRASDLVQKVTSRRIPIDWVVHRDSAGNAGVLISQGLSAITRGKGRVPLHEISVGGSVTTADGQIDVKLLDAELSRVSESLFSRNILEFGVPSDATTIVAH